MHWVILAAIAFNSIDVDSKAKELTKSGPRRLFDVVPAAR